MAPPAPPLLPLPPLPLRPSPLLGSQQRVSPKQRSSSSSSMAGTWRRAAAAGAAALLAAQALLLSPLEASAAGSPALATSPAEQQQQQQRAQAAAAVPAAPSLLDQDPAAVVAGLPPLPTEFPQLPPLALPKYQQITLKNGLRVFLLEDHELPVVRGSLLMRGGTRASPADKVCAWGGWGGESTAALPLPCLTRVRRAWQVLGKPACPAARALACASGCACSACRAAPPNLPAPCLPWLATCRLPCSASNSCPDVPRIPAPPSRNLRWAWPHSAPLCSALAAQSSTRARL